MRYPKRLIEVDLPIKEVSAHARREKTIRHGHISTLHIWWARRPLAACRAVICAALWPDPADPDCPDAFRDAAARVLQSFARDVRTERRVGSLCLAHQKEWIPVATQGFDARTLEGQMEIRRFLLHFIADFANWDASTVPEFLNTAHALTQAAHEALGGEPGTRPLLIDPFAGGGAIPLEALRVGADAFASDLNPIAVLLNKIVLEYIPKHGQHLADEVQKWGMWVREQAATELAEFYPIDPDGAVPVAYIWARTITCEGPGCGVRLPLIRSLWLARGANRKVALRIDTEQRPATIRFALVEGAGTKGADDGTIRKGAATCPVCGYTTPNPRVRAQLAERHGGTNDAQLVAVVIQRPGAPSKDYRLPTERDKRAFDAAAAELNRRRSRADGGADLVPDEAIPRERPSPNARGLSAVTRMGISTFGDLFTPRQALALTTTISCVHRAGQSIESERGDPELAKAVVSCLAMLVSKQVDRGSSLCRWDLSSSGGRVASTFGRQALPVVWDFVEPTPFGDASGDLGVALEGIVRVLREVADGNLAHLGKVQVASATDHPLPDDSVQGTITDPPYYDAIPYGDLSDYFYVWLKRTLAKVHPDLFASTMTSKDEEAIWNPSRIYTRTNRPKDEAFYRDQMKRALVEARRITAPTGIGVVVFAHKSTAGWEALLSALYEAGWTSTASWPLDTEMGARVNAMGTASLASSVHIVCRPRENSDGSLRTDDVGDWRDILAELPVRIHDWMPRLAKEGVVGADAIFACLGPALEVFSRFSRVEKASGDVVTLREYLEHVWAAVAKEALGMIFAGGEATGFEEDARLTAMWLWTLSTGGDNEAPTGDDDEDADDDDGGGGKKKPSGGFALEFDAARKIAQGLGAHIEDLEHVVEVKGETARLRGVAERTRYLFGKDQADAPTVRKARKPATIEMFGQFDPEEVEGTWGEKVAPKPGATMLDRVHQAMILFAASRTEALRRFVVEEGAGNDPLFWRLAQALSALYPTGTDEKRWVDGLLARKRSLGFG